MFRKLLCKLGFHDWIYTKFCRIGSKRHCDYCYTQQQYDYDGNHYKWFKIEDFSPCRTKIEPIEFIAGTK